MKSKEPQTKAASTRVPAASAVRQGKRQTGDASGIAMRIPLSRPIQRVRARPLDEVIRKTVADFISAKKGTCCAMTAEVYRALANHVDDIKETGAELITWAENVGTVDMDIGNHTAATATWSEGTFVVDTTAGQFGGKDIYIDTIANWRSYILGLQQETVSNVRYDALSAPISDSSMSSIALNHLYDVKHPEKTIDAGEQTDEKEGQSEKKSNSEKKSGKSKCYLTTACVEHRGLTDDCHELTTLRAFRDDYLLRQPHGAALIEDYYLQAPRLVNCIFESQRTSQIWQDIYEVIAISVEHVICGHPARAEAVYRTMVEKLLLEFPS